MSIGRTCGTVAAAALSAAVCAPNAGATEIVLTSCPGGNGDPAGLVSAITTANVSAGPDSIVLPTGCRYELTTPNNTWYGPNGLPPIASDITVEGHGCTI